MIFQARDLQHQRRGGAVIVLALTWGMAVIALVMGLWLGAGLWASLAPAALLAVAQSILMKSAREAPSGRILSGVLLMAQVSVIVAAARGQSWQVDLHMIYFAMLAVLIIFCDWRVILAATATVAVHHLVLSFVLPDMVFPGSASLARVLLHAVILLIEASVLAWVSASIVQMFATSAAARSDAEAATADAVAANDSAEILRQETERERAAVAERERLAHAEQARVVDETGRGLSALASGDLAYRIDADFPGDYGRFREDFNAAMTQLEAVISTINASSHTMRSGAGEIAQAASDLSRRTERQAASVEETAAALDEITATAQRTAEHAGRAGDVALDARNQVEKGAEVAARAIGMMRQIEASSNGINQIVGIIDEIAFQTNLLALNAGVEAARAGDAGRGFAVVATEVRGLAQRSADAAKEIKAMLAASSTQVGDGVKCVDETEKALAAILELVSRIQGFVVEIAAASREQATALGGVNSAVNQIDQATQQNAAMVEQSTAASENLDSEASELVRLVSRFRVGPRGDRAREEPSATITQLHQRRPA